MTITVMRTIDRFAGIPLCWISGILRRMSSKRPNGEPRSVLIIKFFGVGSILLSTPTIQSLRTKYPRSRIIALSFSQNEELLQLVEGIDEYWLIEPHSVISFLMSVSRVSFLLLTSTIDVVLDLEFFSKFSTLMGSLARPALHVGFTLPTRWRTWNLTHPIELRVDQHITRTFHDTLAAFGIRTPQYLLPSLRKRDGVLRLRGATVYLTRQEDIICINPNASATSLDRRWGRRRFATVIEVLKREFPLSVFCIVGASGEQEYVQVLIDLLADDSRRVVNLVGKLSLEDLIALFSHSTLLITNDSGPMHLAAATKLPTVTIFGPESPQFYGPLGNRSINLYADLPCSPCLNVYDAKKFVCPIRQQCLKEITVEKVLAAARSILVQESPAAIVGAIAK